MVLLIALGSLISVAVLGAEFPAADARRGEKLFASQMCIQCHSIHGKGGQSAPDLGQRTARSYTPALLASLIWNHAPAMWTAMAAKGITKPQLGEDDAADLFAYFYSVRYFERPGDAGRGKQLFESKHCAECHGISNEVAGGGPPIVSWGSLADPIVLAQEMWNHAAQMREAFARKNIRWPQLTSQELADLLLYLQNLPQTRESTAEFSLKPASGGESLLREKGCTRCHYGKLALEDRLRNVTLTDVAVAMWNHYPKMHTTQPTLTSADMRGIIGQIWTGQFLEGEGNRRRGKHVFVAKNCAVCHDDRSSGAPDLAKQANRYSATYMISTVWKHGPAMLDQMKQKGLSWPRFSGSDMADLLAYLNR